MRIGLVGLFALSGCTGGELSGIVMNHEGELLPGVSIELEGTEYRDLTNALGEYRVRTKPGSYKVLYAKTGYTIYDQEVQVALEGESVASDVSLWNLPPENSVFLYDRSIYEPTTWVIPKRFYMADGTTDYGTQREPQVYSDSARPLLICYRTPRYDARLTRLGLKKAQLPIDTSVGEAGKEKRTFEIWGALGTVGVDLVPVVHSDPGLLRLEILEPLQPGFYAVHWGALEGYMTLDERIFMFEVTEKALPDLEVVDPELEGLVEDAGPVEDEAP
jgi:hypothetical protein